MGKQRENESSLKNNANQHQRIPMRNRIPTLMTVAACAFAFNMTGLSLTAQALYESDFDTLTVGNLVGQDSWTSFDGDASRAQIIHNASDAHTGTQYMQLNGVTGTSVGVSVRRLMPSNTMDDLNNNRLSLFFRSSAYGNNLSSFTLTTFGNNGGDTRMAAITIDNRGDRVFVGTQETALSSSLVADVWYKLELVLKPSNKTYSLEITTEDGATMLLSDTYSFVHTIPTYHQFYFFSLAINRLGGNDWMFDDIALNSAAIPEPSTLGLLGAGLLFGGGRFRKIRSTLALGFRRRP